MIKGDMALQLLTPDGKEKIRRSAKGRSFTARLARRTRPRFASDSFVLRPGAEAPAGERDRFRWYCARCGAALHEAVRHVVDYQRRPCGRGCTRSSMAAIQSTCKKWVSVTQRPVA